ncbi:MAG: dockerin type I domain-containing protein [Pirellulaceae bacterium]
MLLAGDGFHNFLSPHDVNDDSRISPSDALVVINHLSDRNAQDTGFFEDVNDDGNVSPADVLNVLNRLSRDRSSNSSSVTDEVIAKLYRDDGLRVKVEFEIEDSEAELEVKVQNAAPNDSFEVLIDGVSVGQLTTDGRGRGELEFGSDDDDLPLPSNLPPIRPGMVAEIVGLGASQFGSSSSSSSDDSSSSNSSDDNSSSSSSNDNSSSNSSSSSSNSGSVTAGNTFELKSQLAGIASIDAEAKYESTSTNVEFKAELRDAPVNTTYSVQVDGVTVGTLQTDSEGRGRLQFELNDNSKPFPANFPSVAVGTEVRIGDALSGAFRLDDNSSNDSNSNSSDDNSSSSISNVNSSSSSSSSSSNSSSVTAADTFELKAQLAGIAAIDAEAKYESTSTNVEFKVELKDAASNAEYSVVVGGVRVGTLQTDDRGRGRLQFELNDNSKPFPTNFPSIAAGMEIQVGNQLAGIFALDSNDD